MSLCILRVYAKGLSVAGNSLINPVRLLKHNAEIVGIVHPENAASIRVIEKLGMVFDTRKPYFGMDCFRYVLTVDKFETWETDNREDNR